MRVTTIIIAMIILLIGFAASLLASKKLYTPINEVFSKLNIFEQERKKNVQVLKNELLNNIIFDRLNFDTGTIWEKFNEYGIMLGHMKKFRLVI